MFLRGLFVIFVIVVAATGVYGAKYGIEYIGDDIAFDCRDIDTTEVQPVYKQCIDDSDFKFTDLQTDRKLKLNDCWVKTAEQFCGHPANTLGLLGLAK